MPARYSRHYYDLYCMSQTPVKEMAFEQLDLLQKVADFKMKFYPRKWANYPEAVPATLKLVPPDYRADSLLSDYRAMGNMIYVDVPSFDSVIESIAALEKEIHSIRQ